MTWQDLASVIRGENVVTTQSRDAQNNNALHKHRRYFGLSHSLFHDGLLAKGEESLYTRYTRFRDGYQPLSSLRRSECMTRVTTRTSLGSRAIFLSQRSKKQKNIKESLANPSIMTPGSNVCKLRNNGADKN